MELPAARRLRQEDQSALRALLREDEDVNLFLLAALSGWGIEGNAGARWWGVGTRARLLGATWIGRPFPDPGPMVPAGLAVPYGQPEASQAVGAALVSSGGPRMVIGPRAESDALWEGLGWPRPRIWYDQRLYLCRAVLPGKRLPLRRARLDELERVAELAARMMAEDLGKDPREEDAADHLRRTRDRIQTGRTLVSVEGGEIVFKLDVGSQSGMGTQVGGTWVPPHRRGEGLATAGMRAACELLLPHSPRVTLHVNEANTPAVRSYLSAGFVPTSPFRLASL